MKKNTKKVEYESEDEESEYEEEDEDDEDDGLVIRKSSKPSPSSSSTSSSSSYSSSSSNAILPNSTTPDKAFNFYLDDQIRRMIDLEAKKMAEIIYRPVDEALLLLYLHQWKVEKIQTQYIDDHDRFLKNSGLLINLPDNPVKSASSKIICPICYEEKGSTDIINLLCGHAFCRDCVMDYVNSKIQNREFLIKCLSFDENSCQIFLYPSLVFSLLTPTNKRNYDNILFSSFVSAQKNLKPCPAPNCKYIAEMKGVRIGVKCVCGKHFCMKCGEDDHSPASCEMYREWKRLTNSEENQLNADWLTYNTRMCPYCRVRVYRYMGCNYIPCTCGKIFCYECGKKWEPPHENTRAGHLTCPTPPPVKTKEDRSTAESRLKYNQHYFDLWETQVAQMRLQQETLDTRIDDMVREYAKTSFLEMADCSFLRQAVEDLLESRRVLANSFIFGHGLGVNPKKAFFEFIQDDLRRMADQLSALLEKPVAELKRDAVVNLSNVVLDKSNSLNEALLKGF